MSLSSDVYDIVFIGHMCFDEVVPFQGMSRVAPGRQCYAARKQQRVWAKGWG
jgi:hypothetical protein